MIIITAYIECSDVFKPFLVTFLQSTASDPKREFHGMCIFFFFFLVLKAGDI